MNPSRSAMARVLRWALGSACALGLFTGCSSSGGVSYDSVYEGFFGDEPPPSPTEAVAMTFDRDNPDQRRKGISWLAAAPFGGEDEYLASYRLFINDPDPSVRAAAARALGMHGTVPDAEILAVMLRDTDPMVRWQSADGLRKIHNPEVVNALIDRLDPQVEEDDDTRAAAAAALGQYPGRVVFSRLAAALEDRSFAVVTAAHRSLTLLTGHDAGLDPRDWAAWSNNNADPFANQQRYTYGTYAPTPGFFDRYVTFWNNENHNTQPQTPRGLSKAEPAE